MKSKFSYTIQTDFAFLLRDAFKFPWQIHKLGLPIRPAFWKDPRPRFELRMELGLEADAPVAMVMGGGDGVGGLGAIASAVIHTLSKELERSQVSVWGLFSLFWFLCVSLGYWCRFLFGGVVLLCRVVHSQNIRYVSSLQTFCGSSPPTLLFRMMSPNGGGQ